MPIRTVEEIERRFLVLEYDPAALVGLPTIHIRQGYLGLFSDSQSLRVRIARPNSFTPIVSEITRKNGRGERRQEENLDVSLGTAEFLFNSTPLTVDKVRHLTPDGWEIDVFNSPLQGVVLAEFEKNTPDQPVVLPPWIKRSIEVTESLSNVHLAYLAQDMRCHHSDLMPHQLLLDRLQPRLPRIVLTGGPCSGKSTLIRILQDRFGDKLQCVPEVATIIIGQVGIRPAIGDNQKLIAMQRTIAHVQMEFEDISHLQAAHDGKRATVLDRGLMDNPAYLPGGTHQFTEITGIEQRTAFDRYDVVIHLAVPPRDVYDRDKVNNPARSENYEGAVALGERIGLAWGDHPHYHPVLTEDWDAKVAAVVAIVESFLH